MMFAAAALALLATLALALARAALGPTVFDRVQAANTIGTVAMLLLAVLGFLGGRPEFLDLALVYGLLNVISTFAVLKYFRYGNLGDPGDVPQPAEPNR
jgi:multicomponent Na+:H+ antiporter subunit F